MTPATRAGAFLIPCVHCGAREGLVVQLHDLVVTCRECDEETTRGDIERLVADARRLLAWLGAAGPA
jgi:hypothetical protein